MTRKYSWEKNSFVVSEILYILQEIQFKLNFFIETFVILKNIYV